MSKHLSALLALGLAGLAPAPSPAAPFTATEMMKLRRLADPQVSPDGSRVAFALTEVDLAGGKRNTDLWLVPVAGGEPRRITSSPASDSRPRWSPDGTQIAFLSARDGSSQVWALDLAGGEPRKLTSLATGVDGFEWIDAKRLLRGRRGLPGLWRRRRVQREGAGRGGQAFHGARLRRPPLPPLGHLGRRAAQPPPRGADRRRSRDRPHPGRRRRAALQPRGRGLGGVARTARRPASRARTGRTRPGARTPTCSWCRPPAARRSGSPTRRATTAAAATARTGSLLAWRSQRRAGYEADRWRLVVIRPEDAARSAR